MMKKSAICALLLLAAATAKGDSYVGVTPCRLHDSRTAEGMIAAGATVDLDARGSCGVPEEATGVTFALTAIAPTTSGYMLVWEGGVSLPTALTSAYVPTGAYGAAATGGSSRLCQACAHDLQVYSSNGPHHWSIDVTGYYLPDPPPGDFNQIRFRGRVARVETIDVGGFGFLEGKITIVEGSHVAEQYNVFGCRGILADCLDVGPSSPWGCEDIETTYTDSSGSVHTVYSCSSPCIDTEGWYNVPDLWLETWAPSDLCS